MLKSGQHPPQMCIFGQTHFENIAANDLESNRKS